MTAVDLFTVDLFYSCWPILQTGPILQSSANPVKMTAGHWSPSRPSVFYIAKNDGSVDVWDLLDKTHEPTLTQSVSPAPITTIFPFQISRKSPSSQDILKPPSSSSRYPKVTIFPFQISHKTPSSQDVLMSPSSPSRYLESHHLSFLDIS